MDEYCTTPFCNGAFRGEIRYTGAPGHIRDTGVSQRSPSNSTYGSAFLSFFHFFWISHLLSLCESVYAAGFKALMVRNS